MTDKKVNEQLGSSMENLSLDSKKTSSEPQLQTQAQSPPVSAHAQLSSDIQARVLAFQQKRTKAAGEASTCVEKDQKDSNFTKPLPPLPSNPRARNLVPNIDYPMHPNATIGSSSGRSNSAASPMVGRLPDHVSPKQQNQQSDLKKRPSLSQRRGMKLNMSDMTSPSESNAGSPKVSGSPTNSNEDPTQHLYSTGDLARTLSERKKKPNFKLNLSDQSDSLSRSTSFSSATSSSSPNPNQKNQLQGLFANYSKYVDIKSGSLNFAGKASLHSKGVDFLSGSLFRISLDELEFLDELGHGNYGTVLKVLHKPTGVLMAMKEVRLELDENKFTQILMELEILHKCDSPYIVDFYGAFFVEGAVYMCMEYMDGGSLDKIYDEDHGLKDEPCLAYISECVIRGLKQLKDQHNIIHRDVKPTNILVNTNGKVKLCDFGVSGNLVASLARTNIGCQSYMAPERIKSLNPDDSTYSVQSDIWSLGLTILEVAAGHYPYPAETYGNIFSQLSAIVDGEPPKLDPKIFSKEAQLFVKSCLNKNPNLRPSYGTLLNHPWLQKYRDVDPHMDRFVTERVHEMEELKAQRGLSRSNSTNAPQPSRVKNIDNARTLLKKKVKAPPLHRGGLMNSRNPNMR
ncbi:uncharacterized protein PRCAT00002625001 [Priceomyces carsonii]|uniref:uncharacterized protein n=1 Tax=Priceomyces carsonii TaxID=28549 RepID=UPI002ED92C0E|nr:unnamed protein product [Priceomyces carsonii]